jgi:Protein of unknown function (DUF3833)
MKFHTALAAGVLSLLPLAASSAEAAAGKLVLEEFFNGSLTATGVFNNTRDGSKRMMKVAMRGKWDGKALTLREDFVYSDGERDRKTWVFTKTGEGRYVGTREDVIGTADVNQDGDAVRLSYVARVKTAKGDSYDVRFNDLLQLAGPRRVINTAQVTYFVVGVGNVELDIRKR